MDPQCPEAPKSKWRDDTKRSWRGTPPHFYHSFSFTLSTCLLAFFKLCAPSAWPQSSSFQQHLIHSMVYGQKKAVGSAANTEVSTVAFTLASSPEKKRQMKWCKWVREGVIYWKCRLDGWIEEECNWRHTRGEMARTLLWVDGIWWQTAAMRYCQSQRGSSSRRKKCWNGIRHRSVFDFKRRGEEEKGCEWRNRWWMCGWGERPSSPISSIYFDLTA